MRLMIAKCATHAASLSLTFLTGCIPTPFPGEMGPVTHREEPLPESATHGRLIFVMRSPTGDSTGRLEVRLQREYTEKVRVSEEYLKTMKYFWSPLLPPLAILTTPLLVYRQLAESEGYEKDFTSWGYALLGFAETEDVPRPRHEVVRTERVQDVKRQIALQHQPIAVRCSGVDGPASYALQTDDSGVAAIDLSRLRRTEMRCELISTFEGVAYRESVTLR